jgi:hypothetical protein
VWGGMLAGTARSWSRAAQSWPPLSSGSLAGGGRAPAASIAPERDPMASQVVGARGPGCAGMGTGTWLCCVPSGAAIT